MEGKVIKILSGFYTILNNDNQIVQAVCKKTLKKEIKITVGDNVHLEKDEFSDKYIINKVFDRKNSLIRPVISNIDNLFIVVSTAPYVDYYLIDKLFIYCQINNITPYLIVNKSDLLKDGEFEQIKEQYQFCQMEVLKTCAMNKQGIDQLKSLMINKVSAFAGQSGVGKSSILNAIYPDIHLSTNEISSKISRGRHTTRVCEIMIFDNVLIADTPGFSMLDLNIEHTDLKLYYPEFPVNECKYSKCNHINTTEKECAVMNLVKQHSISSQRYDRYVKLYLELQQKWRSKYD